MEFADFRFFFRIYRAIAVSYRMFFRLTFAHEVPHVNKRLRSDFARFPTLSFENGRCPIQARFWLEWGSSTVGQSLPAARSRFRAVHSDSISTRPSQPCPL